jgi:hypothetical protein
MKKLRRLWMPILVGMLLLATVVGVVGARPGARPLEQGWMVLTVGSNGCSIADDGYDYDLNWDGRLMCSVSNCYFSCPLNFPAAGQQAVGAVSIKRLTMYAIDNDGGTTISGYLNKLYPPTAGGVEMAHASTFGSPNSPFIKAFMDTSIAGNPVYRTQFPAIWIVMNGSANMRVYGFHVHYVWQ